MNKQNKLKIVIPSYNNEKWVEYNAASIISQTYKNYDVLYINDNSTDSTPDLIENIKKKYNLENWKILNNPKNMQRGYNVNPNAPHITNFMDSEDDILLFVDGDDWLINDKVLENLNNYYNQNDPWMTYGGMYCWPSSQKASPQNTEYSDHVHNNNLYRKDVWRASHLRSFKWFLYKQIKKEDLIWSKTGEYYYNAEDLAVSYFCLEMCPKHKIGVVDFPTYAYNEDPEIVARGLARQDKDIENPQGQEAEIREKTPYNTLPYDDPEYVVVPQLAGGLGNMMFQIAAAKGISTKTGHTLKSDFSHVGTQHKLPSSYKENMFRNIPNLTTNIQGEKMDVPSFEYIDVTLNRVNTQLTGYFQSPKHFDHIKESIVKLFSPSEDTNFYIAEKYGNLDDFVSLHVRRGDYTKLSEHHHNLDIKYYLNAIDYFQGHNFMVFSDDIEWCKKHFDFSPSSVFVEGEEDFIDLHIMSKCKHNVIANSTFSWWAAYLNPNPNKTVIYPDKWFGPKNSQFSTRDLFPNDWVCLSEDLYKLEVTVIDDEFKHLHVPNGRYSHVHKKISKHIKYNRDLNKYGGEISLFTDSVIYTDAHTKVNSKWKLGWIMESREINPIPYNTFDVYKDNYDFIFTHDPLLLSKYPDKTKPYIIGGCWIKDHNYGIHNKTKDLSMIFSEKQQAEGHRLRHIVANEIRDRADLFGKGINNPVDTKEETLLDYRYSIIIENTKQDNYITEKLIDCLIVGTIPIYWGCPNVSDYFNMEGIPTFNTLDELKNILPKLTEEFYNSKIEVVKENLELAKKFCITEDWLYENYFKEIIKHA